MPKAINQLIKNMLFRLYIGSNNNTHKLESKKAIKIVSKHFEGLTAIPVNGYWQGKAEKSLIIEVETENKTEVLKTANELKTELHQMAIGLSESQAMQFIS